MRQLLSRGGEIDPSRIERAIRRLRITPQALRRYVRLGYIRAIRGKGRRNIGISLASLLRFLQREPA